MSSLTPEAYAVIEGRHSDPFRYLGPHVENDSSVVRVFLPDAEAVATELAFDPTQSDASSP
jgi:1,4-alpha-glucan branching enzyme